MALGIALIGVSAGATFDRWQYQAEQQHALLSSARPAPRAADEQVVRPTIPETPTAPTDGAAGFSPPKAAAEPSPVAEPKRPVAPQPPPDVAALDPDVLGRLEIPRLGVSAIVRVGADKHTLARAVGLVPGTARPGEIGNTVLAGHRDTFFRPLRKIRVDDRIRLLVPPHEYEYRVDSLRVVSPEETSVLRSNGTEELTLVTCHPFFFIGPAPDRFIVRASRVR